MPRTKPFICNCVSAEADDRRIDRQHAEFLACKSTEGDADSSNRLQRIIATVKAWTRRLAG